MFDKIDKYKLAIDELRPFEGSMLDQLKAYYRVGLTYSSNAIEGNTLTISETKVLLEDGLTIGGKPLRDTYETLGHAQAYDFMFSMLKRKSILVKDIQTMHKLFYDRIDSANAGIFRKQDVCIRGSEYPVSDHKRLEQDMEELVHWANCKRDTYHPVEFSALLHKKFVFIHPFIDGNGRLARLLMNASLIQEGYTLAIIPPILRAEYMGLLEKAHTNDKPFIEFISDRVFEAQKEIVKLLHIKV